MQGDFRLGVWLVQPSLGRVSKGDTTVRLRAKVMDLLVFLAARPGEVISKDALLNGVWGTEFISESALTRVVTELRQALGDEVDHPRILETIPKRGYRLIAPVEGVPVVSGFPGPSEVDGSRTDAGSPEGGTVAAQGLSPASTTRRPWVWVAPASLAVVVIVVAVGSTFVFDLVGLRQRLFGGGAQTIKSIAVLPLENLSGNPEQQPFVDGMYEALINTLGQINALRVISRTSVMGYAPPQRRHLPAIGRELNVDAIVEGRSRERAAACGSRFS